MGEKNFISYAKLSEREYLLFQSYGFERLVAKSKKVLGLEGLTDAYSWPQSELEIVNNYIGSILELIGKYSNENLGIAAKDQHTYFSKISEIGTFPYHLHIARWNYIKAHSRKTAKDNVISGVFDNRAFPTGPKKTFTKFNLSESKVKAVGALYMISLLWEKLKKESANRLEKPAIFKIALELSSLIENADLISSKIRGGKKGNKADLHHEAFSIVEPMVLENLHLTTKILVKRCLDKLAGEIEVKIPASSGIARYVRKLKKENNLQRN